MTIRAAIVSHLEQIVSASKNTHPLHLTDDLVLVESGLDSLGMAILVTRLEDSLGVDPFTDAGMATPPVTLGDFIKLYENAANGT